jgi:hypothetical protein
MAREGRTFRLFVSSTFQDLKAERNTLHAHVFPRLRQLCQRHDCRFQAIDLRWSVSEQAAMDQQTILICLREIERCHQVTPRPNFLVLLGDRYGWCPPPPRIPASEFDALLEHVSDDERDLLLWQEEQPDDGKGWYRRDDNARPSEYRLRPRQVDLSGCRTREEEEAALQAETAAWAQIEPRLQRALETAAGKAELPAYARLKYERSATEQEITVGALQVPDPQEKVVCFFRSLKGAPDDWRPDEAEDTRQKALKERLRECVPDNVHECKAQWTEEGPSTDHLGTLPVDLDECLALVDADDSPGTICVTVWRRLARTILHEIENPSELPATPDEKIHVQPDGGIDPEGRAHCDFANGLLRFFVGRETPLQTIRDYLEGHERRPLAVVAEGGAGKSALMAKALEEAKNAHADAETVYRFIGATPSSSDGRSLLAGLCREISRRYGGDDEIPYDYNELASELEKRMALVVADRPLILLLDALDQLSEAHGARRLTWLPRQLPENVRVVVSTRRTEDTFKAVTGLQPEEVALGPMSREEGEELLGLWLDDAGRALTQAQHANVLDAFEKKESAGRPLYLKLAFEEARLWTSYAPPEHLEPGLDGVIRKNLFDRLTHEENHGEHLVASAIGYLATSRYGLAEDELLDTLSRDADLYTSFLQGSYHLPSDLVAQAVDDLRSDDAKGVEADREEVQQAETWLRGLITDPGSTAELKTFLDDVLPRRNGPQLPVVLWSRLFFDLSPYLTERMGDGTSLLAFYHRELEDVGEDVFAHDERGQVLHGRLAGYFRLRADPEGDSTWTGGDVRGLSELPYHLTESTRWQELHDTLTDFRFLEHKASEVGVEAPSGDAEGETVYTGVFRLQQDFDHALQKIPGGGGGAGARRPLIVTAVDFGDGLVIRCPLCNSLVPLQDEWLGQEMVCPQENCGGSLKVNPARCQRPSWAS